MESHSACKGESRTIMQCSFDYLMVCVFLTKDYECWKLVWFVSRDTLKLDLFAGRLALQSLRIAMVPGECQCGSGIAGDLNCKGYGFGALDGGWLGQDTGSRYAGYVSANTVHNIIYA